MFRALQGQQGQTRQDQGLGMVRNPSLPPLLGVSGGQFGQLGRGQVSGPSLEEVLSQSGFEMPKMKTGVQDQMMRMFKDPITGEMKSGGAHAASHAKAMSDFYGQNPEALNIAKQHQQDQQYNPGGGRDLFNASPLRPPQEIMPQPILSTGRPMSGTGQPTPLDPSSIRLSRGDGGTVPPGYYQEPPTRPGGMENLSGSLGGQIIAGPQQRGDFGMGIQAPPSSRPNPYSAPPQIGGGFGGQMGGGMGGGQGMGQGMGQFMQFMQTMMQMFQQFQGGGGRGMGGGFGGPSPFMPQQQQYGQYQPQQQIRTRGPDSMMQPLRTQRMSNQFNPNNAFGGY